MNDSTFHTLPSDLSLASALDAIRDHLRDMDSALQSDYSTGLIDYDAYEASSQVLIKARLMYLDLIGIKAPDAAEYIPDWRPAVAAFPATN